MKSLSATLFAHLFDYYVLASNNYGVSYKVRKKIINNGLSNPAQPSSKQFSLDGVTGWW